MCSTTQFMVHHIPVVLHGDSSEKLFLYIHGKMGRKEEAARFAEIVCPKGYQVLSMDLPGHGERADEMERFVPWEVVPELRAVCGFAWQRWEKISLYANSIGAYFSLLAYRDAKLEKSLFVSPILDMEKLIRDMMGWAGGDPGAASAGGGNTYRFRGDSVVEVSDLCRRKTDHQMGQPHGDSLRRAGSPDSPANGG